MAVDQKAARPGIIKPPNPKTNEYTKDSIWEVMSSKSSLSGSVGGFAEATNGDIVGLGQWQNKLINPLDDPEFDAAEFRDEIGPLFDSATGNYRESFLGTTGTKDPLSVDWTDQGGNRGYLNQQFVTETSQDLENFASNIGFDIGKTDIFADKIEDIFGDWHLNAPSAGPAENYIDNIHIGGFNEWENNPHHFTELAKDPNKNVSQGAALDYSRTIEDMGTIEADAEEDALTELENTEEDLNREQQDQQRQFIADLRSGKAAQGITGVRTGRDFRRNAPAVKNIALARERAREEYDSTIEKSIQKSDKTLERAELDLKNVVMDNISGADGIKNKIETRKQTFHMDEIEDEMTDASLILDVFYAHTTDPAPWPGQCPAGQHRNEADDACVDD